MHTEPDHQRLEDVQQQSPMPVKASFPLAITSSDTPHPTSRNESSPESTRRPTRRHGASRLGYQNLIAVARGRDCDPLT
jgi:hypothetical protein